MRDPDQTKAIKRLLVLVVVIVVVIILAILLVNHIRSNQAGHQTFYYDKYSGETVANVKGKTPETFGTNDGPAFLGFGTLITHGFTQQQLSAIETGYQSYFTQSKAHVSDVSMDTKSYRNAGQATDNSAASIVSYNVVFDFKDIHVTRLESSGLSDVILRLYDKSGNKLIYTYTYNPDNYDPSADGE